MEVAEFNELYESTIKEVEKIVDFTQVWPDSGEWSYRLSNRMVKNAGLTDYDKKCLVFSKAYINFYDEGEIKDTILHEIAHVLTPDEVKIHGEEWRKVFILIGGSGVEGAGVDNVRVREYYESVDKYEMFCPNCGSSGSRSHRKTHISYACSYCCKKFNRGKFSNKYLLICREIRK